MKIVLLAGGKYTGKTTTLNMVYDQLAAKMQNPPPKKMLSIKAPRDFESSPLQHNNKTVAIYSMGDIRKYVFDAIIKYCGTVDVLVIPCSTGYPWAQNLVANFQHYKQHYVVQKTANNNADCQTVISKI